jgi:hypothetical protein
LAEKILKRKFDEEGSFNFYSETRRNDHWGSWRIQLEGFCHSAEKRGWKEYSAPEPTPEEAVVGTFTASNSSG